MSIRFQIALGILGLIAIVAVPVIFSPAHAGYTVRESYNGNGYVIRDNDSGHTTTCREAYNGDGYNCN